MRRATQNWPKSLRKPSARKIRPISLPWKNRVAATGIFGNLLLLPGVSLVLAPWIGTSIGYGPEFFWQIAAATALAGIPGIFLAVGVFLPKKHEASWEAESPLVKDWFPVAIALTFVLSLTGSFVLNSWIVPSADLSGDPAFPRILSPVPAYLAAMFLHRYLVWRKFP